MNKALQILCCLCFYTSAALGQFTEDARNFSGGPVMYSPSNPMSRSAQNPTACTGDTSYFPNYGTTAYRSVSVRKGSSLGQYFGTNQSLSVSGFRFYAYALTTNPAKKYTIRLICNLYKAGADSMPSGSPLASDTVEVDTVMGSNILLSRIEREAHFSNPVSLNYDYIITVESDSLNVSAGLVTNSWLANPPDGKKKNLGCGSVSGKWYRCLQLNIGGVTFDADMQLYPFVKYKLGADFSVVNNCYNQLDTVKFNNLFENNVSSLPYYNYYVNYKLDYFCQRWSYDGSSALNYVVDGFYKPGIKKNFDVRLISVVYSYSSGQCYDTVHKTVYFKPAKPQLKSSPFGCIGDSVSLNVSSDAGVNFKWYNSPSDTTPFFTGNSYKIYNVQQGDTFYVQAVNGDCKSAFLLVDFVVSSYPQDPTVKNDSICQGAVANLRASTDKGILEWFGSSSGGSVLYTGTDVQTGKLFSDTQYYVQANNKGCLNKGGRVMVSAFVNNSFAPDKPTVISDTFMCLRPSNSITLRASQSGTDTLRWFNTSSGGSPLSIGDSLVFTPTTRMDDVVYVETWNGVCGSGRSPVTIHVYDYPTIYGLRGDTICGGDSARPFLSVPWGTANWYDNLSDQNPVATGKTPVFGGLTGLRKFYVASEENGCLSPNRDSIEILVYTPPVPTSATAASVCAKSLGSMEVKVPYGNVNWYYDPADQTPFYTGQKVNAGLLLSNVTYYYETEYKGCTSGKQPLTIVIKPRPTAGFTWVLQWQNRLICTPITSAGLTLFWDWGDGSTTTGAPYLHQYASKGSYTVRLIATSNSNGCKDTADIPVLIDHTGVNDLKGSIENMYPIPVMAGGTLNFSGTYPEGAEAHMYLPDGRLAETLKFTGNALVIPQHMNAGLYIIKTQTSEGLRTGRLIIGN